jgi:hypothetical protein
MIHKMHLSTFKLLICRLCDWKRVSESARAPDFLITAFILICAHEY